MLVLALAACDSGGLEVVVYAPSDPGTPAPATVKLYLGKLDPNNANVAIAPPPTGTARFTARRYERMLEIDDDIATPEDGAAHFLFRKGGDIDHLDAIIAVGRDANGTPTSAAVLFDLDMGNAHVKSYSVGLNAITDPIKARAGFNGLVMWGPRSRTERDDTCLLLQNTYPDPESASLFMLAADDRDCDGLTDMSNPAECVADMWNGTRPPQRSELSCLMQESDGVSGYYCLVGGPPCADGTNSDGSCTASRYCAPDSLCEGFSCGTGPNAWECSKNPLANPNTTPGSYERLECDVAAVRDMNGGLTLCPNVGTFMREDGDVPVAAMCTRVAIRSEEHGFQDKLVDGSAEYKVTIDSACMLSVTPHGTYATLAGSGVPPAGGLLAIDFQTAFRNVVFPIQFNVQTINSTSECTPVKCYRKGPASLRLKSCIATPP